jgi:hypothetical protein
LNEGLILRFQIVLSRDFMTHAAPSCDPAIAYFSFAFECTNTYTVKSLTNTHATNGEGIERLANIVQ